MAAATIHAPPAEEIPPVEIAGAGPSGMPLCFVIDEEPSMRHFLSLILHGAGIDAMEFANGEEFRHARAPRAPDLIFHDISLDSSDAIASMVGLGKSGYRGCVQLMSNRGAAVLDHVSNIGGQHQLKILPVLKKPFETDAIIKIIRKLKLGAAPPSEARISLTEALANGWIEFWFQPKIDMRKRQLAGAEAYARARHPQHGIVMPNAFIPGASEGDLIKLSELAVISALKGGVNFAKLGLNIPVAVNIPLQTLTKLPVPELIKAHRPAAENWPGLVIDLNEEQIITEIALANDLNKVFAPCNVKLAIDDFGRGHAALARAKEVPFAEFKLDRQFVADCSTDKLNAPICKTVVDLAHSLGGKAVALGIEKASDAGALISMGCDFGQGFLLGQPMPEERFLSLLRQRAGGHARPAEGVREPIPA